jgi:two-component system, NtrC family, sensor kinase
VAIGALLIRRVEAGPFSDKQMQSLGIFADQAVIAIENVRLFKELEERNRDLTTALDRQTATSEILRVISRSPTDVQPVLDAVAENAARLCGADDAVILTVDGRALTPAAHFGGVPVLPENASIPITRETAVGTAVLDRQVLHVHDMADEYQRGNYPASRPWRDRVDYRTVLCVPLVQDDVAVGAIVMRRLRVQRFTDKQIELVKTFADQAVIAIENVRLFTELQEKNRALTESLEQQTATSEILRVISSSPTDVQPVFDTIVARAVRLCDGLFSALFRFDGELMHQVEDGLIRLASARAGLPGSSEASMEQFRTPRPPTGDFPSDRVVLTRAIQHVIDVGADPSWDLRLRELAELRGYRSIVAVPMLRGDDVVGIISVTRNRIGGFTPPEIALLQTFADQAVIAVENTRLLSELQARNRDLTTALDKQTATSEILRIIAGSQTDVQPVFDAIVHSAVRLCGGSFGAVFRFDGHLLHLVAQDNSTPEATEVFGRVFPMVPTRELGAGRALLDRTVVHVADASNQEEFAISKALSRGLTVRPFRAVVSVPMLRDDTPIGVITVGRTEPGLFPDNQIALLKTFADQAVIAIENVRLFKELEVRNRDLTESLEQQTATSEILRVISSSPTDIQPVFDTIVQNAVRLCGALYGTVTRTVGDLIHLAAQYNVTPEQADALRHAYPVPLSSEAPVPRSMRAGTVYRAVDVEAEPEWQSRTEEMRTALRSRGVRSHLAVPMLRRGTAIGAINLTHREVGAFSDAHVELVKIFADQAVIAIENVRLFKELEAANRELAAASQHKSEFLANMSHELRTPLNAIIGFSEVLSERMFGELNEKQEEYSKDIHASGQHLLSLINDILDLSKIEAGRMELELSDFHLPTALDNALTSVRERAARRSITLDISIDERLGEVRADERKIRQVVLNLLSNAIKFTPEGGRIAVAAVAKDGIVEVSVSDTGVGIAPEDQEAVFEEFRQVGTAEKKAEGTGLGLTLCRKFIELHGGEIWVKSQVGVGSTFTFAIPVRRDE